MSDVSADIDLRGRADVVDLDAGGDFAVAAHREEGVWAVAPLPGRAAGDLCALLATLRQRPPEAGPLAFVAVDDDFFVAARVVQGKTRLLISDATAAVEWPIAREVLDTLGVPVPEDDEAQPAGDLAIFADLGLPADEVQDLCEDFDLYPDEVCRRMADRLGFGPQFDRSLRAVLL
jgi:putative tRNA adenosine deaminase-associated protein